MSKWILVHDIETRAMLSININYIEAVTKRDDGGSLIVTENGDRIKVKESVSEVAQKVADA
jgi:uncharacterized protein YlzI (FlbEa/FlbD family)